jgi:hypothetical protein
VSRSAGSPVVVVTGGLGCGRMERHGGEAARPGWGWWEYGPALAEDPAEWSDVAVLDYSGAFPAVGVPSTDPLGMIDPDNLHATNAGHALIGMIMADALAAGVPSFTEKGHKPFVDLTPTLATWIRGDG